ncbi:isopropylmalate isomerase large subunit [Pseudooceanicola batsensis HTCC2597]|uniref:3-isopropylmalate dehydratase large subunit n=1 Tax=Pseudooceanicola batsensis (strain ATCC BAA-863 / DSM 15984 / KCTC 12145 / HTCC2597) TaxID=252305 RepID=A3U0B9_PSEBH|nr:3-isopropylmalate dehydratase large subunit [Pseudooceanicola batsensis]EAQ02210.1 isopropylmalate isomerase large subunit [Pseudooceanicola batsensis HTCC2597]
MTGKTLYDKIWEQHVVAPFEGRDCLLYVDRHLVQEVSSPQAFASLDQNDRPLRRPDLHIAVADHAVPTRRRGHPFADGLARQQVDRLRENAEKFGIAYMPMNGDRHGIVHVIGPETGFTLPGCTLVCGDSHTSTHGAFGCIAFGIGASECASVFATQTIRQTRQKTMRVNLEGGLPAGVTVKDVILALIAEIGTGGGVGYAIEYAGSTIAGLSMEARMTLCNMTIEAGSRVGMVAPDEVTFAYLEGRPLAPEGEMWDRAVAAWSNLRSDEDAVFDREITFDTSVLEPQVSWGTTPEQTGAITGVVPNPEQMTDRGRAARIRKSLDYMDLTPGTRLNEITIDRVFIGSCTNGRLEDLRAAARVLEGRRVAGSVKAIAVPGSAAVRLAAEAEGLHEIFLAAGFEWRDSGCSMCVAMNDDRLEEGERCASTSNRNFEGRQGKGGRTHLMSPQMAAAAAVTGRLSDVRELL